jgi:CAAX amino terminal protease family.
MNNLSSLNKSLIGSFVWLIVLVGAYLASFCGRVSISDLSLSLPFFIVCYFLFFAIGKIEVVDFFRKKLAGDVKKEVIFPAALWLTFAFYLLLNGYSPFKDLLSLFPFFLLFPVLAFSSVDASERIGWFDFFVFVLFLLPTTLVNIQPKGELPFHGDSFDSIYRISIMLVAVFAFGIVCRIDDIGFYPEVSIKKLLTVVWVWLAFYTLVLVIGVSVDFIRIVGHQENTVELIQKISFALITGFLHTAVFEELFFRGLLQNMLAKRIGQSPSFRIFLGVAFALLFPLALVVGYTLKGGMQWFPALVSILLFATAWFIENRNIAGMGVYTSLAITSTLFGLVHYHAGSIVYIGFACIAGWGYGYVYIKTKNVFYSALTHALVNASALIFGLSQVK